MLSNEGSVATFVRRKLIWRRLGRECYNVGYVKLNPYYGETLFISTKLVSNIQALNAVQFPCRNMTRSSYSAGFHCLEMGRPGTCSFDKYAREEVFSAPSG